MLALGGWLLAFNDSQSIQELRAVNYTHAYMRIFYLNYIYTFVIYVWLLTGICADLRMGFSKTGGNMFG